MRERFATELVKEVLGPRGGPHEVMTESPLTEYITGVLAPQVTTPSEIQGQMEPGEEMAGPPIPEMEEDEFQERDVEAPPLLQPALDPQSRPSSFGISFTVESENVPAADVCLTWARYERQTQGQNSRWKRIPQCAIISPLTLNSNRTIWLDSNGQQTQSAQNAEVSFHVIVRQLRTNRWFVNMYFVNKFTWSPGNGAFEEYHIFQPQIRVVCCEGTRVVPAERKGITGPNSGNITEEQELEFLYRNRPVMARGFLCSAVWKDIDPQNPYNGNLDFPECRNEPPFFWVDGQIVEQKYGNGWKQRFEHPDVRSEFVPVYSIPFPDMDWPSQYGSSPVLDASRLADTYDPDTLRNALQPLADGYEHWINQLQQHTANFQTNQQRIAHHLIQKCRDVLRRIRNGINLLLSDNDVRLAFCFANRAMDLQSRWKRRQGLVWRPFQMDYILMVLESLANPRSPDRDVCDLLWVPTGAGKTEAYLFLILFTLALRRRRAIRQGRNGAGVAVITRYTLRLLTIQQFRRLLAAITAAEYLRVEGLTQRNHVGWYPAGYTPRDPWIWGVEPFSAGLWVGGGVTPNRLKDTWGGNRNIPGALSILKGQQGEGEPAQVTHCPACETLLAVPATGITGNTTLYLVIYVNNSNTSQSQIQRNIMRLQGRTFQNVRINSIRVISHNNAGFFTLAIDISVSGVARAPDIDELWRRHIMRALPQNTELVSVRASRPGYFTRWYRNQRGGKEEHDFEIFCPNPACPLRRPWAAGQPLGWIYGTAPHPFAPTRGVNRVPDMAAGMRFVHVQDAFRYGSSFVADRIPVPAYTVDEQIYHRLPSVVVATVDKFARPSFEPRASALFGNVDHYHCVWGYYREGTSPLSAQNRNGHPSPAGRRNQRNYVRISPPDPPELILQDELHLIEGPLGSLAGFYETAVEHLCNRNELKVKYIASTATVRNAEEQVQAVFTRRLSVFPPPGLTVDDRFFIRERELHPLDDSVPGRLYLGICAPGRGPLTPLVRICARLLQTAQDVRMLHGNGVDPFWTLVGYFNAIRELGGARALYRQDIPARLMQISSSPRRIPDDGVVELSSRTDSTDLPAILNRLNLRLPSPDVPDALFTTSMFGTGVDIPRLSLMVVNGQPKTTSAYIQATGRVGRDRGALVVTFLRATRPRDLSHYEMFCGYHRQLHGFVEPITVYPFAPGVLDRACGPVCVFLLRNALNIRNPWHEDTSAFIMAGQRRSPEVTDLPLLLESRAQNQPSVRQPQWGNVQSYTDSELDRWQNIAHRCGNNLRYVEYATVTHPQHSVVLGDPQHQHAGLDVVYENAPQSLRDIEETCGFET